MTKFTLIILFTFLLISCGKSKIYETETVFEEGKTNEFTDAKLIINPIRISTFDNGFVDVNYTLPNLRSSKIKDIKIGTTECKDDYGYKLCITLLSVSNNGERCNLRILLEK